MFSCGFCEISKNTFFTEDLWTTASKVHLRTLTYINTDETKITAKLCGQKNNLLSNKSKQPILCPLACSQCCTVQKEPPEVRVSFLIKLQTVFTEHLWGTASDGWWFAPEFLSSPALSNGGRGGDLRAKKEEFLLWWQYY